MNQQQAHIQYLIKIISKLISLPETNRDVDNYLNNAIAQLQKAMAINSIGNQDVEGYVEPQRVANFNDKLGNVYEEADQAMNKKQMFEQMIKNNQIAQQGAVGQSPVVPTRQPTTQGGQV